MLNPRQLLLGLALAPLLLGLAAFLWIVVTRAWVVLSSGPGSRPAATWRWLPREVLLQALSWAGRVQQLVAPRREPALRRGKHLVVLVPGFMENEGHVRWWASGLAARGYDTRCVDLPSTFAALEDSARVLATRVRAWVAEGAPSQVSIVGHSMGGLIARVALELDPELAVTTLVSVCSPHAGTPLARAAPGRSARDMTPGSALLQRFPPSARAGLRVVTLESTNDNIVPGFSTRLEGARHVVLEELPCGHVAVLLAQKTVAQIEAALAP